MSKPDDTPEMMQRREILRRAAWLLGGAISAPAALAVLQGCSAKDTPPPGSAKLEFLNAVEFPIVAEIAEIMIPKTDTSGAKDAGVPEFIDRVLAAVYPDDARQRFREGCGMFEADAKSMGNAFFDLEPAQRAAYVKQSLEAALASEKDPKPFILMVRELALLGYFTSKVGITENMEYVSVPTAFHGCVPLSQMKKPVYWE